MELTINNLSKSYKNKVAVNNISTTLTPGIWGLLGANGAGKTTLMRMIAGILTPTKGNILFCDKDIRNNRLYRASFGFLPQEIQFGRDLTANDYLEYIAAFKNISQKEATERINRLLEVLTLGDVRHKKNCKTIRRNEA